MIAALTALILTVADQPKGPDLGFDYRALILQHAHAVAEGKADRALEVLDSRASSKDWFQAESREAAKKHIARIYGASVKHIESEVVGCKQITSRIVRIYAASHFDRAVVTYSFLFVKNAEDEWRLFAYQLSEGIDELEKLTPLIPLQKRKE
jgi:hypothetical protein